MSAEKEDLLTIFLSGDVMTGRGIDQALPHPSNPLLHEPYVTNARDYVALAQHANGPFSYPVDFAYIWGDALEEWERRAPDLRIINLETGITQSSDFWKGKGVHYRMHPKNTAVLATAKIDFCSLANNHILDWGYTGLMETMETLSKWKVMVAGAGRNRQEAGAPAVFEIHGKGKVSVFSYGFESSGIPADWAATDARPGVNLLEDLSDKTAESLKERIHEVVRSPAITIASIHWGGNWDYQISKAQIEFTHKLIDEAGIDLIHGHSSHHVKGIEVYNGKLVLYGCGDFLNDYEGIGGYEEFRGDLSLMYFASLDPSNGKLVQMRMVPTRMNRFRVTRASDEEAIWLRNTLNRESQRFGTQVKFQEEDHSLLLLWD